MGKAFLALLLCGGIIGTALLAGCDFQTVPIQNYATTNAVPSRYKVVSSDYYHVDAPGANFQINTVVDTQGTNYYMIVENSTGGGIAIVPVPAPVRVAEDWRK